MMSNDWEPENPLADEQEAEWREQSAIADEEAAMPSEPEQAGLRSQLTGKLWMMQPLSPNDYPGDAAYHDAAGDFELLLDELEAIFEATAKEVIGPDEEVPEDIWHQPYPQTYRDRNNLKAQQRQALSKLLGRGEDVK